jgi:Zn-dependent protease
MQTGGIKIGRIFGIELWLDYSWFVLFFLIGLTFTAGLLPAQFPDLSPPAILASGLLITLLFFVSIIIHELSHSLYAKKQGLEIRRITLFIFGGASEVVEDPKTPGQEFVLAAVGPLASFVLSLVFGAVWLAGEQVDYLPLIAIGSTLGIVNFALAVFNVLPGFPMDGGRMFRAAAWKLTGDMERATRYAATGGKIFAFLLIFYGALQLLLGALLGGLWLILIGFFLNQAASYSYQQTMYRLLLKDVKVRDLMQRDFISVPRGATIRTFLQKYVLRYKETTMPIEADKTHPAGLVDVKQLPEPENLNERVGKFTLKDVYTLQPQDEALKALDIMNQSGLNKLPVADHGKLVGILTSGRVRAYLLGKHKLHDSEK